MMHDRITRRSMGLALVLGLLAGLVASVPAQAASSIQIDARPLLGGRYEVGGWAAISVSLVNEAEPTEGYLVAETRAGEMRRFVEMPAGARKTVTLYVQPEPFQRRLTVRYEEPNGSVESVVELRVLESSGGQVAVVGDGAGALRPQLSAIGDQRPEPVDLSVADLPERPEPLGGFDAVVWAGDSTGMTDDQRRSLERWVADGGTLVVLGGPDWQARTDRFVDLLPVESLAAVDEVPLAALAAWSGSDAPATATATVAAGTVRDDARLLAASDDGTPLLAMRPVGAGRVIFVATDLATEAYRGWSGSPVLWSRLLPSTAALERFWGPGIPAREEAENAISMALGNVPSLEVPPAELLLAVIVAYILLIGPISYVVLRRLDRRELAWITAPVLVVLFTACSYGIGNAMKGGEVIVHQISLVRTSTAGSSATVEAYAGIFSPERRSFAVSVEADALMAQLRPSNFGMPEPQREHSDVVVHQGEPARLENLAISVFGFEGVRAEAVIEHEPALTVSWSTDDRGNLVGTVTNTGSEPMSDVAYISSSIGIRIGDLAPGAEETFTVRTNANGSSASDGVYGFGGFGGEGGQRERLVFLRRQVIDALVGFGGWMPGLDVAPGTGRGPYIIGWREAAGPLELEVDESRAQRLHHVAEVLAVRPAATTGEVTISPARMSVNLLERTGDAFDAGSGMVTVGEGSATFGIGLPLEAAGMQVDELEIVVGPDPSFVLDPGMGIGGGFWPPGYRIEVRDLDTGEWVELGDLAANSVFEIADPATVLGEAGRVEVRIVGTGVNPQFGGNGFYVSARASGVIDG